MDNDQTTPTTTNPAPAAPQQGQQAFALQHPTVGTPRDKTSEDALIKALAERDSQIAKLNEKLATLKDAEAKIADAEKRIAAASTVTETLAGFAYKSLEQRVSAIDKEVAKSLGIELDKYKTDPLSGHAAVDMYETMRKSLETASQAKQQDPTQRKTEQQERSAITSFADAAAKFAEARKLMGNNP